MDKIDISVIIINYNTFEMSCACIRSIQEKTVGLNYEIILVDNASKECDPDLFKAELSGIKLIKSDKNLGFAGGNNLGIEAAKGEYILLLNSDTLLINNAIQITYDFIRKNEKIGAVSAQLQYPNGKIQICCNSFPSAWLLLFEFSRIFKLFPRSFVAKTLQGGFADHRQPMQPDWIWGTFFMFPAKILKEFKEYKLPDDFFMYCEDMQWCLEFKKRGYKISYLPQAKILHYGGGSAGAKNELARKYRNQFFDLYYSTFHKYVYLFLFRILVPSNRK